MKPAAFKHDGIKPRAWNHDGNRCAIIYRPDYEDYLGSVNYGEEKYVLLVEDDADYLAERLERWAEKRLVPDSRLY